MYTYICRLMIRFTQDDSQPDWHGYLYAVLMFVAASLQSLFLQQYFYRCKVIGMNIRTSIIATVYSKVSDACMCRSEHTYCTYIMYLCSMFV